MTARGGSGSEMVIGWFASERRRERRRKVRLDRKHLEPRARRFLRIYLNADETRKPEFYQAVQEASEQCRPSGSRRLSNWKMLKSPKPLPAQRCKSSWSGVP